MRKQHAWIYGLTFAVLALLLFGGAKIYFNWKDATRLTADDVLQNTLAKRTLEIPDIKPATPVPLSETELSTKKTINILLLGLDSRKTEEAEQSHCDAIHMFSLNLENWTVKITSVPRGTFSPLPPGRYYLPTDYYLGNACGLAGHDYTIKQIERLIGIKADYVVKVGFSEVYGILRALKMPTAETLQWLRNRQTFAIGDPQRSHNQAVYMKDLAIKEIDSLSSTAMLPIAQIAHSFTDSTLDFSSFYALLRGYAESGLANHPERVTLNMIPAHEITDYHFDFENPASMQKKYPLPPILITEHSLPPEEQLSTVQKDIIKYLNLRLAGPDSLQDISDKKLWLQIEDEKTREDLHYQVIEKLAAATESYDAKVALVSDYIFEKQILGPDGYLGKGKDLLRQIIEKK